MKFTKIPLRYALPAASIFLFLNIPLTTRYGINGALYTKSIPLYAKAGAFFYRDWMYKDIVRDIVGEKKDDVEKALAILTWVNKNIRYGVPQGCKSIDDHPLNIIIRQYGEKDQIEDVFTILCSYARMEAFRKKCYSPDTKQHTILSLVKADGRWLVFDATRGKYFLNKDGHVASIDDYLKNRVVLPEEDSVYYGDIFKGLVNIDLAHSPRAEEQMPIKRVAIQLKKILKSDKLR